MEDYDKENKKERDSHKAKIALKSAENEDNLRRLEEMLTIDIN